MPSSDDPFSLVIFGASGDLAHRKLIPALWSLYAARTLPEPFTIVGTGRTEMSEQAFRDKMREGVRQFARLKVPNDNVWGRFASSLVYVPGDPTGPELYARLRQVLEDVERKRGGPADRLYYLSTPPSLYDDITVQLGKAGLAAEEGGWTRIIIEKPFGHDLRSAQELNELVTSVFREEQVYRIDHYLGKETVQNVLALRFANGIFEPLWNRNHVAEVQFTVAETVGVEGRGGYYEEAGALRDMIQNHLLQVMCLVAMEPPVTFDPQAVRDEKSKVMQAVRPIDPAHVDASALRAQYAAGFVGNRQVPGYLQEKGVKTDSTTETYAALGQAGERDRHPVPPDAAHDLPPWRDQRGPEPPGDPHPARRGHLAHRRGQGAGAGSQDQPGHARVQVPGGLRRRTPRGLRATPARRHPRRSHALLPRRLDRAGLAPDPADPRALGAHAGPTAPVRGRFVGPFRGRRLHRARRGEMAATVSV
jgi:glucose-6-phosphate 1-dehydrogenase